VPGIRCGDGTFLVQCLMRANIASGLPDPIQLTWQAASFRSYPVFLTRHSAYLVQCLRLLIQHLIYPVLVSELLSTESTLVSLMLSTAPT
jgi:hypothetical protein